MLILLRKYKKILVNINQQIKHHFTECIGKIIITKVKNPAAVFLKRLNASIYNLF